VNTHRRTVAAKTRVGKKARTRIRNGEAHGRAAETEAAMERHVHSPPQAPPVERLYMRPVVGRGGKPDLPEASSQKASGRKRLSRQTEGPDYFVGLTTFHIRRRGR
jgi:hypothetical protein